MCKYDDKKDTQRENIHTILYDYNYASTTELHPFARDGYVCALENFPPLKTAERRKKMHHRERQTVRERIKKEE